MFSEFRNCHSDLFPADAQPIVNGKIGLLKEPVGPSSPIRSANHSIYFYLSIPRAFSAFAAASA
jgi:hypothetical protein